MTGIVVVTWNSCEVIGPCLDACLQLNDVEIVVVDNHSTDCTVAEVQRRPQVRLIANNENRGFAGGVNQGIRVLPHPAVLLLNPDAVLVRGFDGLISAALTENIGAAGGRLTNAEGSDQFGFNVRSFPSPIILSLEVLGLNRMLPWNSWNRRYRVTPKSESESDVDQPAGAFLMVNRSAWEVLGGFDEAFWPVWFEDVDFCLRLKRSGFRVSFVPSAVARHAGGHSAARLRWEPRQLFWYGNLLRYARKHFRAGGRRTVCAAVMAACIPRGLFSAVSGRGWKAWSVYGNVFGTALACWSEDGASDHPVGKVSREEKRARQL